MSAFNFQIEAGSFMSNRFRELGILDFKEASAFIRQLPYKRNSNKNDLSTVFTEQCGTCSTKHAVLYKLALENNINDIKLILGIIKMNAANSPQVSATLEKHNLSYIPEAHNYLMIEGERHDYMKANFGPEHFVNDLLSETEINADQITDFKINFHQQFLKSWLQQNPDIRLSFEELWQVREQCIADLSRN